jgi:hypothetical protein
LRSNYYFAINAAYIHFTYIIDGTNRAGDEIDVLQLKWDMCDLVTSMMQCKDKLFFSSEGVFRNALVSKLFEWMGDLLSQSDRQLQRKRGSSLHKRGAGSRGIKHVKKLSTDYMNDKADSELYGGKIQKVLEFPSPFPFVDLH